MNVVRECDLDSYDSAEIIDYVPEKDEETDNED